MAELARYGHDFVGSADTTLKKDYIEGKRLVAFAVVSATAAVEYNSHDEYGGVKTAISETLSEGTMLVGKITDFVVTSGRCAVFFSKGQMEEA